MKINILGTKYKIETHKISEDETLKNNKWAGYCSEEKKLIVIADMSEKEYIHMDEQEQKTYREKTLRHEIVHAFLNESGLSDSSGVPENGWATYEEMIDWFAIQFPKILRIFKQCKCI